jgi:hypothetical protein
MSICAIPDVVEVIAPPPVMIDVMVNITDIPKHRALAGSMRAATSTIYSTAPDNRRFSGLIRLDYLMKESLLIRQGDTIAACILTRGSPDTRL